jgi:hypothetical protein
MIGIMAPRPKPPKTYCFICGFLGRFDICYPVVRWHLRRSAKKAERL